MTNEATPSQVAEALASLRHWRSIGGTPPLGYRRRQLEALQRMMRENTSVFEATLASDLGKSAIEATVTELGGVISEAEHAASRLRYWAAPKRQSVTAALLPASASIQPEPRGVSLIMSPWNYPVLLTLSPLIGAIAAGCSAIVKPSELAPATSAALATLIPQYLDPKLVTVVEGDAETARALLELQFDLIFYTGNGVVGRKIASAAAQHLTPTVLELGGKSPNYIHRSANVRVAARRIAWAKFVNAGQTCIAPDYVVVDAEVAGEFHDELALAIESMFGSDAQRSDDFGRIVNERHFDRLSALLENASLVLGGQSDKEDLFISPTVLSNVSASDPVMQEEIFGPILPVIEVDSVASAIETINLHPTPLTMSIYTADDSVTETVVAATQSGSVCVNFALAHMQIADLPFGGIGESGYGSSRGKNSFKAFSHYRPIVKKSTFPDTLRLLYPPFSADRERLLRKIVSP
ncbi:aldehyde dehydrogenase family protein [Humidisolicoccus flavus]|uniref:aldehyde dehydrogenase family protein n=1 Tax=Humidisolicoccus flavus TaxID=3111414 RepID=UPI00324C7EEC